MSGAFVPSAIILLAGGVLCVVIGTMLGVRRMVGAGLFVWHTLFAIYYSNYVLLNGGDAFTYYQRAQFDYVQPDFGTDFVVWLTSFPVAAGLAYWPTSLLYNCFGALGLVFFFGALNEIGIFRERGWLPKTVAALCVLMPSLSVWTSGIGKDSIAFLSVGLFLWSSRNIGRRRLAMVAAILIMLAVRPHMAALMVLSVAVGALFVEEVRTAVRFSSGALAAAGAITAVPFALGYAGAMRFESLAEYISDRQEQNLGGGSSIDISSMNPLSRLLSFIYRPLPNEAVGLDQLAASIDNLFLVALTVLAVVVIYQAGLMRVVRRFGIALLYGGGGIVLLSQVTANLGLASRQKVMAVPALMLIVLGALAMARDGRSQRDARRLRPYRPARAER